MRTIRLSHVYDHAPKQVWAVATDFDCLAEAVKGLLVFKGMPSGKVYKGQVIKVTVSMFGILPAQPYEMTLVECDDTELMFVSNERGMGVEHWQHTLRVVAHPRGAELIDEIEIEAGWRTGMIAAWARYMYGRRHKPRVHMLARYSGAA